jgi:hypothetical protein
MTYYVVDPDGTNCYGKYDYTNPPENIPEDELVEVDDLDAYDVVEWRYEDGL